MANKCLSLVLHGGAGAKAGRNYDREIAHMRGQVEAGRDMLKAGMSALDVAEKITAELEISGLYVAGRGASPNNDGVYELDAAIMDGALLRCGSVAALVGYESPIAVAREVLERTQHVMLAGGGAAGLAAARGYARIADP